MTGELAAALRDAFGGRVLTAGDSGYDRARATKAGGIDNYPMAIAYAADAEDVRRVVVLRPRQRCAARRPQRRPQPGTARPTAASCST